MKQHIVKFACSALLGAAIAGSALVGTARAQGPADLYVSPSYTEGTLQYRVDNRHWWRRHHRGHRGGGIYFDFGNGSFSLNVPPPRYYPRYHRHYSYPRAARSAHVNWCYSRYKSYRHWDNTFQPYHGGRKQCYSPYY